MKSLLPVLAATANVILLSAAGIDGFAPAPKTFTVTKPKFNKNDTKEVDGRSHVSSPSLPSARVFWKLCVSKTNEGRNDSSFDDYNDAVTKGSALPVCDNPRARRFGYQLRKRLKPVMFALATVATFSSSKLGQQRQSIFQPPSAHASTPIVLRPSKPKEDPPMVQAMKKAEKLKKQQTMEEFDRFMQKCNDIEDTDGKKARSEYEKRYQVEEESKKIEKKIELENLKRNLLDEGKDPHTDMDAEREVFLFEHGVDLEKISGTPQNEQMIKNFKSRGKKNAPSFEPQRYIIKCQVSDLKARGIDPLVHFSQSEVMEKTHAIYKMDDRTAAKVAKQYEGMMEKYGGRLTPGKNGESPFVRPSSEQQLKEQTSASKQTPKELRAQVKADAKAKRAAEKQNAKKEREAQRKAKAEAKARAKASRAASKKIKSAKKKISKTSQEVIADASSPAHKAADSEIAATAGMDFTATAGMEAVTETALEKEYAKSEAAVKKKSTQKKSGGMKKIMSKVAIGAVASGGAFFGFNYYKASSSSGTSSQFDSRYDDDNDDDDDYYLDDDE